jgi:hypothetical protein
VVILLPQKIIIIATIATITTTTKIIRNIEGGPEWSFAPGPPDTFARPCTVDEQTHTEVLKLIIDPLKPKLL